MRFLNHCGQPLTRFGVHAVAERYALKAQGNAPYITAPSFPAYGISYTPGFDGKKSLLRPNNTRF